MENRWNFAKRAFGWSRIEGGDLHKVYGGSTESLGAAKNLAYVEAGLELIENQYKLMISPSGNRPLLRRSASDRYLVFPGIPASVIGRGSSSWFNSSAGRTSSAKATSRTVLPVS